MDVRKTALSGLPVLKVIGDVDHSTASALEEAVEGAISADGLPLLLDLTDCPYLDSGGLSVIISAVRKVRGKSWLGVITPNANLSRLFELVGLTAEPGFRVVSSSGEATAALGG